MKNTMLNLFGYDDYNIARLEARAAQELHELIKLRMDKMTKAAASSSINSGQKLKKLTMAGLKKVDDHHDGNQRRIYGDIEETEVEAETDFRKFKNFDILESPPADHRFLALNKFAKLCGGPNGSLKKKISQEWEILKAELPSSIFYVRVYKSRVDLMRVVVIDEKAATNSYHHGLFFFDVRFPKEYPSKPPKLYYHCNGESHRILHRAGEISSDLFKNWREQNRSSQESPIINLLVLIQQLASNLSPNCDKERRMINFDNKDVMMQKSSGILPMLGSPPKQFEVFVKGYFLIRAHYILLNYKAFMNADDEDSNRFFFKLVRALEANGAYCEHHYNKQQYNQVLMEERQN
ncbi:Ubiquitin-fold modifier-conjugating enzyme [Trema orientale]|uniref:Ubiquitin-fold modifier-conjugating enzyme n=1 Tax=Trema orientale TaxID=63057 RepID=A0A2P5B887_TREOI|nr:Ubiquitin-fold modifier-conjugating enzyme [Trema orientale]